MDSKKFLIFIAVIALVPLFIVLLFFMYRINLKRVNPQKALRSGAEKAAISLEGIQSSKTILQEVEKHPLLKTYLQKINGLLAKKEDLKQSIEQQALYKYIEEFQSLHPEFEEIMIKNPQTGIIYMTVPATSKAIDLPEVHLMVTIPLLIDEATSPQALLQGKVNIDLISIPLKMNNQKSVLGSKRKLAMVFVWLFLLLVIIIPIIMFMVYRQMNKMLDSQLPSEPPPPHPLWKVENLKKSQEKKPNE